MKKVILSVAAASFLIGGLNAEPTKVYNKGINIIPMPKELVQHQGEFKLNKQSIIIAKGKEVETVAKFFQAKMKASTGYPLSIKSAGKSNYIKLSINPQLKAQGLTSDEGYTLISNSKGVEVVGVSAKGLFWGMQSLLQLLPAEIESKTLVSGTEWTIPSVSIKDEPAFAYRGMMLDAGRHFASVEEVKRNIDLLSMFKINKFHWHLTEDQGWRIEIKKYPRLTEFGSKRTEADGTVTGGFYTQAEVKDIVAYAAARGVEVIPEIEMPGHSMGAIASYPYLACNPKTQYGNDFKVRNIWDIEKDVYCAGKESTFDFLQDVIDEVAALFPSQYFHIGGDESPKERWKKCQLCQDRIKKEGLKDEHELQSYFIRRAEKMLAKHGKKLIGWDEILEGGLAPSATVMSWRGEDGGIQSANAGHDVIMTPGSGGLYIDHYQGDPKVEPVAIGGYSPLKKVYSYYPVPAKISEDKRHHILGAQVNVWAEYIYTDSIREYRTYPRLQALAEAVWTPREQKNFGDFSRRINNAYVRLDQHQINYHIPQPEQPNGSCNYVAFTDSTLFTLQSSRPIKMVYTTDGSEPTPTSTEYTAPFFVKENKVIKVASVLPSGKMSKTRAITFAKEDYRPATKLGEVKQGFLTRTSVGDYNEAKDFANATNWTDGTITYVQQVQPNGLHNSYEEFDRKAVVATGYIQVLEDGVYYFSTDYDELWIDGERIVNNAGLVKKGSHNDKSIALKAGYHAVKVVFVGATHGGFTNYWGDGQVRVRKSDSDDWSILVSYIPVNKK